MTPNMSWLTGEPRGMSRLAGIVHNPPIPPRPVDTVTVTEVDAAGVPGTVIPPDVAPMENPVGAADPPGEAAHAPRRLRPAWAHEE